MRLDECAKNKNVGYLRVINTVMEVIRHGLLEKQVGVRTPIQVTYILQNVLSLWRVKITRCVIT